MKKNIDTFSTGREKSAEKANRPTSDHKRRGTIAIGLTAVVIAITIFINLLIGQLPEYMLSLDLSNQQIYTVSDTSVEYLKNLDSNIELILLAEYGTTDERIVKFVDGYASLSDKITVKDIDPILYPSVLEKYDTEADTLVVVNTDTDKYTTVNFGAYYSDGIIIYDFDWDTYESYESAFDGEGQITSAIEYVTSDVSGICYQLTGHNESEFSDACLAIVKKANIEVVEDTVNILMAGGIPDDCTLLLINNPTTDLADDELTEIQDYMQAGGSVMLLIDDTTLPNFASLCAEYGLELLSGYVGDTENYYQQYYNTYGYFFIAPVIKTSTAVGSGIEGDAVVIAAKGMTEATPARDTITVEPFMTTSENGIRYIPSDDSSNDTSEDETEFGEYVLGATCTEAIDDDTTSTLTVISAVNLIQESLTSKFTSMSNLDLFSNCVLNATDTSSSLVIPTKSLEYSYVSVEHTALWSVLLIGVIPVATFTTGLFIWIRRRKR